MLARSFAKPCVRKTAIFRSFSVRAFSSHSVADEPIRHVLIYDGVCNLCNAGVQFVLARSSPNLRFCAAQTKRGTEVLNAIGITHENVMARFAYVDASGTVHRASTAALQVSKEMNWPWPVASVLLVIPPVIRDAIYDVVAKYRYQMFGRTDECTMPPIHSRDRFLM